VAVAASLGALTGCGGGGGTAGSTQARAPASTTTQARPPQSTTTASTTTPGRRHQRPHRHAQPRSHKPHAQGPTVPPAVAKALHAYVAALDSHDGPALCALFKPGALDVLHLPKGSGCSGLSSSLGYRPPHGLPQWDDARIAAIKSVVPAGAGVRATVTIVDRYHGNPQPSVEDDVVFLQPAGGSWLITQPSVTIYRAIGVPDPPPSVLAAP
jgi:hypothetical protein